MTAYGRSLMEQFIGSYTKDEYCTLAGHGMKVLAEAMDELRAEVMSKDEGEKAREEDRAGSAKSYNRRWAKKEGLQIFWIRDAGHNSNTDKPEEVNRIIREFAEGLGEEIQ